MAATTITRTTWTDDSGAGADGTIITNAKLQEIYAAIDAVIAAAVTFGATVSAEGFGTHTFSAGGTGNNTIAIRNTTSGTTMAGRVTVGNNTSATLLQLYALSSAYTTVGHLVADAGAVESQGAGGIAIAANHASGAINFYTGGTTLRATITSAGALTLTNAAATSLNISGAAASIKGLFFQDVGVTVAELYTAAGNTAFDYQGTLFVRDFPTATSRLTLSPTGVLTCLPGGTQTFKLNAAADPWIQLAASSPTGSMTATNLFLESIFSNADTGSYAIYGLHQVQTAAATSSVGLSAYAAHTYTTGTTGTGIAAFFGYEQAGTGGTTTAASAVGGSMFASAGTITTGIAFSASFPTTSGTVTTGIGFKAGTFGSGVTTKYAFYCDDLTARSYFGGGFLLGERTTAPANPADGTEWQVYAKADLFVIAYNHGGTMKYRYLTGTSTDATWTYSTSAP